MQGSAVDSTSNIDGRKLQCPECNRRFIRPEHMRRHLRNHDTSKRFTCHVCSKQFARRYRLPFVTCIDLFNIYCADAAVSDILSKHRAAHIVGPSKMPMQPHSNGSVLSKSRACYACAKAREKCSKGLPCMRCSRRCLDCVYPGYQQHNKYDHPSIGGNNSAPRPPNMRVFPPLAQQLHQERCKKTWEISAVMAIPWLTLRLIKLIISQGTLQLHQLRGVLMQFVILYGHQLLLCPATNNQLASILASDPDPSASVQPWPLRPDGLESGVEAPNQPINWLPFDELIDPNLGSILDETIPLSHYDGVQWLFIDTSTTENGSTQRESWNLEIAPLTDIDDRRSNGTSRNTSGSGSSPSKSTYSSDFKQGDLYATSSNGARNACSTRAKRYTIFRTNELPHTDYSNPNGTTLNGKVGFPDVDDLDVPDDGIYNSAMAISEVTYHTILQHFDNVCLQMHSPMPCFGTQNFPPISLLNLFVKLYFKCFDPIFPFIHLPSLNINKSWLLTVAIAAIGSHYCQSQELTAYSSPLHEFCRRLLQQESERSEVGMTDLPVLQARILNHVGLCYSESRKLDSVVRSTWSFNVSLVNSKSYEHLLGYHNDKDLKSRDWDEWVGAESWRRLYFTTRV